MDEDPVINCDLNDFVGRPSTAKETYDVVFATSVLEHVEDDEKFMRQVSELLKPGGVLILTCDFNDGYKHGDPIPSVCHRMYTQTDFRERIIPSARQCIPLDATGTVPAPILYWPTDSDTLSRHWCCARAQAERHRCILP